MQPRADTEDRRTAWKGEEPTVYADLTEAEAALAGHAHHALCISIADAFTTMAGMDVRIELEPQPVPSGPRMVAAIVALMGQWTGAGVLECAPGFACLLANRMLGIDSAPFNEDALDAAGEMANIIFGGTKTELEQWLGPMRLGTPTVLYGSEVSLAGPGEAFTVVPVSIEEHAVRVKLHLAPAQAGHGATMPLWTANPGEPASHFDLELSR